MENEIFTCRGKKLYENKNRMKRIEIIVLVSVWILSILTLPVKASIQADYKKIEARRKALEERRGKYEANTTKLEKDLHLASLNHRKCTSGPWRVFFNVHIDRANEERIRLEKEKRTPLRDLKNQLQKINKKMQNKLKGIERTYPIKNFEYERALRNWMEIIEIDYFLRLEEELFDGYGQYQNGIEQYVAFINGAAEACKNGNYTGPVVETLIDLIDRIFPGGN